MDSARNTSEFHSEAARYSANVEIELYAGGRRYSPSQVCSEEIIFAHPVELNESTGELLVKIDGREHRWTLTFRPTKQLRTIVEIVQPVPF